MKYVKFYFILLSTLNLVIISCSDIQDEITPPEKISVHGKEVMIKTSTNFHGRKLVNGNMESCKLCHASDFTGGTAKVSCLSCHAAINVHSEDINNPASQKFHGKFIANINWDLSKCSQCHGSNYAGGIVSPTCNNCHKQQNGPEACNTCHGDFKNPSIIYPPRATNGSTTTTDFRVGAHQAHLVNVDISNVTQCNECHKVPEKFNSVGHIDNTQRAEVVFGKFSSSGPTSPSYNFIDNKCSNTYCHGNFEFKKENSEYQFAYIDDKIVGNNFQPIWNRVDGSQAACGTCHDLPPKGHIESRLRSCGTCHVGVVDRFGKIIDKTKHINGKVDLF
ncbi:MAG: hypothetical protein N2249_03195 [Melioribacter sp.]|nr:hypothetical protein [Melioribacter sp.]